MNRSKRLYGNCSECGGSIEFSVELVGTMTQCPRCRKQTELTLALPPEEPALSRRIVVISVIAVVILVLSLIVTVVGLKHYTKLAVRQQHHATLGFDVSAFSIEKGQAGNEIYAVGTVANTSGRPRAHVTLELNLLDAEGKTLQVARAYRPTLEPGAKWDIRLPVTGDSQPVSAQVASLKEGQ
jgi:hypothetical protein